MVKPQDHREKWEMGRWIDGWMDNWREKIKPTILKTYNISRLKLTFKLEKKTEHTFVNSCTKVGRRKDSKPKGSETPRSELISTVRQLKQ